MASPREMAKEVVCEIIQANGGQFSGKTRLFKAFYFAHLFYWQKADGVLTSYPIVRMPQGPGIDKGQDLLLELAAEGKIEIDHVLNGPYPEETYKLLVDLQLDASHPRHCAIESAVAFTTSQSAAALSDLTHENSRSWQQAQEGDVLNIYLDLLDDTQYQRIMDSVGRTEEVVAGVFSELA